MKIFAVIATMIHAIPVYAWIHEGFFCWAALLPILWFWWIVAMSWVVLTDETR